MSLRIFLLSIVMLAIVGGPLSCQDEGAESNVAAESSTTGCIISGVPALRWTDGMCTFIGSLNTCLNYLGEKTTYQYLMGVSGAAFAARFKPGWSESSADAALNDDHPRAAMQAVGYSYSWATNADEGRVTRSLAGGVPVIGIDVTGHRDWGIIVGYERMGEMWLCRTYHSGPTEYHNTEKLPWSMFLIGDKRKPPAMVDSVRTSIRLAIQFAKGERKIEGYAVGPAAYEAWIEALQPKNCQSLSGKRLEEVAYINALLHNSLIDARYAALTYLTWAASLMEDADAEYCEAAAALYQEEIDILKDAKDYVRYPQNIKTGPKWSAEMRAYQAEALRQALIKDRAAISALDKIVNRNEDNPL